MPRVISGSARGTRLAAPRGEKTRPTGDKVKEALFSILGPHMPAAGFLDLFAGTGQIGIEAASRGCTGVVLVEQAAPCLLVIKANLTRTHLESRVEIIGGEAGTALVRLAGQGRRFDVIFLDPPYRMALGDFQRLAGELSQVLQPDGILVLEHESRMTPPAFVTNLQLKRSCLYGTAMLSFYSMDQSAEPKLL
jgi:16S rRNA (guanine966-N2)-methyltransferase